MINKQIQIECGTCQLSFQIKEETEEEEQAEMLCFLFLTLLKDYW
jgi:hypothetical protein